MSFNTFGRAAFLRAPPANASSPQAPGCLLGCLPSPPRHHNHGRRRQRRDLRLHRRGAPERAVPVRGGREERGLLARRHRDLVRAERPGPQGRHRPSVRGKQWQPHRRVLLGSDLPRARRRRGGRGRRSRVLLQRDERRPLRAPVRARARGQERLRRDGRGAAGQAAPAGQPRLRRGDGRQLGQGLLHVRRGDRRRLSRRRPPGGGAVRPPRGLPGLPRARRRHRRRARSAAPDQDRGGVPRPGPRELRRPAGLGALGIADAALQRGPRAPPAHRTE